MKIIRNLIILYLLAFGLLWVFRAQFIYPFDPTYATPQNAGAPRMTADTFKSFDDTQINIWSATGQSNKPLLIYFHGNAGNLANRASRFKLLLNQGYGVVAIAYRGSSGSDGSPSEVAITKDAQILIDNLDRFIANHPNRKIIYYGESLGTGIAIKTAITHPPDALVLEAPYVSIVELAAKQMPFFPIRMVLDQRWESITSIKSVHKPVLVLHGDQDTVIPVENGKRIFAAAPTDHKVLKILKGRNHHNLWSVEGQTAIYSFINGI